MLESIAVLGILVGTVFYGRAMLRAGSVPTWLAWVFVGAAPGAFVMRWLTNYIPHGAILPFTVAVAIGDGWVLAGRRRRQVLRQGDAPAA